MLVAPYYGGDQDDARAGWHEPLMERIRKLEFPQYMLDSLPVPGNKLTRQSILRLDHIMPLGKHHNSYQLGSVRLSEEALALLDDWLVWLVTGKLSMNTLLAMAREELLGLEL